MNIAAAWVLAKANRQSLNIEGSFQHIVTDLYAFIGTFVAGLVILFTGLTGRTRSPRSSWPLSCCDRVSTCSAKPSACYSKAPRKACLPAEIGVAMAHGEHVKEVHDLHVWELAPGHPILTAHVLVAARCGLPWGAPCARADAETALRDRAHDAPGRSCARATALDSTARRPTFKPRCDRTRWLRTPGRATLSDDSVVDVWIVRMRVDQR